MIQSILNRLKGTDWELLTEFVSPDFFDVVPAIGMLKAFGRILKDTADRREFIRVCGATQKIIKSSVNSRLLLDAQPANSARHVTDIRKWNLADRQSFGSDVLKLYFAQIFSDEKSILDLRSSSFISAHEWSPKPVFYEWDEEFRLGLRNLYRGFYFNDDILLRKGLTSLNLAHAEEILRVHFGEGEQNAVRFSLGHFKKSIHAVFVSCKKYRTSLHPDFFALGVYLLCLYENLEALNCSLDVQKAFREVTDHD